MITRSHVGELTDELVSLAAQILKDGPTIATARRAGVVGELLAAHLDAVVSKSSNRAISQKRMAETLTADHANNMRRIAWGKKTSLKEVIAQTGLNKGTIHDAEKVRRDPRLSTMLAIANALQTPAADIWPALKAVKVGK